MARFGLFSSFFKIYFVVPLKGEIVVEEVAVAEEVVGVEAVETVIGSALTLGDFSLHF